MRSAFEKIRSGLMDALSTAGCNHMFYWLHTDTGGNDVYRCGLCGITETEIKRVVSCEASET